jgi:type I restriction enzyme R subunit
MTGLAFTESIVESSALAWLESLGWTVKHGTEIAPGELMAERSDFSQVVLERCLRDTLVPKLIPGEPQVSDAQRIARRVAQWT